MLALCRTVSSSMAARLLNKLPLNRTPDQGRPISFVALSLSHSHTSLLAWTPLNRPAVLCSPL